MITLNNLNQRLLEAQYAVRGAIVQKAEELEKQGRNVIYCNIGNPQALNQKPLTYIRQILSLLEYPELLASSAFPKDIVAKAQYILEKHPHGTGAYSQSTGIRFIREEIARFIESRDGASIDPDHIFLTDGASKGVQSVIYSILKNENDGIMIPIPQYPLYSATLTLYGGKQVHYHLNEEDHWSLDIQNLRESYDTAVKNGVNPVAIAVINPGNPTGAVLSRENIESVIAFAKEKNIAILADEVYQENVYLEEGKFYSFARVLAEMGEKEVSVFSFHSVSKGFLGECGHRGGYFEFRNVPQDVIDQLVKLQSINLCSNISGQLVTYLMICPPQPGDESYELYLEEKNGILNELKAKAKILSDGLNKIDGVTIDLPQGAMYAFVKVDLPYIQNEIANLSQEEQAAYHAKRNVDYCLALLEQTGICVVPGSGFGQKEGTYHFRTTFLPSRDQIEEIVAKFEKFHIHYISNLK